MGSFHEGEEAACIVDVHAGTEAAPGYCGEFYRFASRFGRTPAERMAQSIFNQLGQRLAGLMGEALGQSEELVSEASRCSHMSYA
jgi:hypothetical protein